MVPPMEQMFPTAEEGEEVQRKTTLLNYRIWGEFIWIFFSKTCLSKCPDFLPWVSFNIETRNSHQSHKIFSL